MFVSIPTLFTVLTSLLAVSASPHSRSTRGKSIHARGSQPQVVPEGQVFSSTVNNTLQKRDGPFTGFGTFFYVGLGACGQYSQDSDMMVALNSAQYGSGYPGPNCFRSITVQANGVTVSDITILDECPTCDEGSLDMSPGLFQRFADESVGVLDITWWWNDGSSGGTTSTTSTSTWEAPTSTWTPTTTSTTPPWTPTSTSTWQAPTSSSTSQSTAPSSSSSWTSSSSSSSSSAASSSTALSSSSVTANATTNPFAIIQNTTASSTSLSASASASTSSVNGTVSTGGDSGASSTGGNLVLLNGLVAQYGGLVVAGAGGHAA